MTQEKTIVIEGNTYSVVISDEKEALLAGKAAKRALIGFQSRENLDLGPALYVVESLDDLEGMWRMWFGELMAFRGESHRQNGF